MEAARNSERVLNERMIVGDADATWSVVILWRSTVVDLAVLLGKAQVEE
jgi:hypothetical protein